MSVHDYARQLAREIWGSDADPYSLAGAYSGGAVVGGEWGINLLASRLLSDEAVEAGAVAAVEQFESWDRADEQLRADARVQVRAALSAALEAITEGGTA